MNNRISLLCPFAIAVLLPCLAAQRTWIVDAAGGPGADTRTITDAVARAAAGDRIRVRLGTYRGVSIDKPLSVQGEQGVKIEVEAGQPAFRIDSIAAGRICSVRGFEVLVAGTTQPIEIADCVGRVLLADLVIKRLPSFFFGGVEVSDCAAVSIDRCDFGIPLSVIRSNVAATHCNFREATLVPQSPIHTSDSHLVLTQCGGNAEGRMSGFGAALTSHASIVELRGDSSSLYRGGITIFRGGTIVQHVALRADAVSTLILDPRIQVIAPMFDGWGSISRRAMPWLTASGGRISRQLELTLDSPASEFYALFVGLPGAALPIANWGKAWLDLRMLFQVQAGRQSAAGRTQIQRSVPNDPNLIGLELTYQAVTGNQRMELSNGASVVLFNH